MMSLGALIGFLVCCYHFGGWWGLTMGLSVLVFYVGESGKETNG